MQEARQLGAYGEALTGGERKGNPLDDFELGNSPMEYSPEVVGGKTIVLTTSNGTRALHNAGEAAEILVGSFNNIDSVAEQIVRSSNTGWVFACAGTSRGTAVTPEDVLFAGELARLLTGETREEDKSLSLNTRDWELTGAAIVARGFALSCSRDLFNAISSMPHAQRLKRMGKFGDVEYASRRNITMTVPRAQQCMRCSDCSVVKPEEDRLCIRAD